MERWYHAKVVGLAGLTAVGVVSRVAAVVVVSCVAAAGRVCRVAVRDGDCRVAAGGRVSRVTIQAGPGGGPRPCQHCWAMEAR